MGKDLIGLSGEDLEYIFFVNEEIWILNNEDYGNF